jgi:hypothetical protein
MPPGGVRKGRQQKLPSTQSHWYWITRHLRVRFTVRFGTNRVLREDCIERGSAWFAQPTPNRFDNVNIVFHVSLYRHCLTSNRNGNII